MAGDLAEFVVANRIDKSAKLVNGTDREILELLPDLREFERQPCFTDEFREMVANISSWNGLPEHRWSAPDGPSRSGRRVTA